MFKIGNTFSLLPMRVLLKLSPSLQFKAGISFVHFRAKKKNTVATAKIVANIPIIPSSPGVKFTVVPPPS
jgi:hypothetical protein